MGVDGDRPVVPATSDDTEPEHEVATEPAGDTGANPCALPVTDGASPSTSQVATEPETGIETGVVARSPAPCDDMPDPLVELLERWEERYRRNEEATPESLGVRDPALMAALRDRIERQKRLYDFMKHSPAEVAAGPGDLPVQPGEEAWDNKPR